MAYTQKFQALADRAMSQVDGVSPSTATSQADYDKLKPQGTQGTVGGV